MHAHGGVSRAHWQPGMNSTMTTRCFPGTRACTQVLVVVLQYPPWTVPASSAQEIRPGMPSCATLSSPLAVQTTAIPTDIIAAFPGAAFTGFLMDVAATGGSGVLRAKTGRGGTASITFSYESGCRAHSEHGGPTFTIVKSFHAGIGFVVTDATTYLSTNPCVASAVILSLQQDCRRPGYDVLPAGSEGCVG